MVAVSTDSLAWQEFLGGLVFERVTQSENLPKTDSAKEYGPPLLDLW